jgi:hypothetical protein
MKQVLCHVLKNLLKQAAINWRLKIEQCVGLSRAGVVTAGVIFVTGTGCYWDGPGNNG